MLTLLSLLCTVYAPPPVQTTYTTTAYAQPSYVAPTTTYVTAQPSYYAPPPTTTTVYVAGGGGYGYGGHHHHHYRRHKVRYNFSLGTMLTILDTAETNLAPPCSFFFSVLARLQKWKW